MVANLYAGFIFFGCVMVDALLSLENTMTATVDPSLPAGMVAIAGIAFPSSPHSPAASSATRYTTTGLLLP